MLFYCCSLDWMFLQNGSLPDMARQAENWADTVCLCACRNTQRVTVWLLCSVTQWAAHLLMERRLCRGSTSGGKYLASHSYHSTLQTCVICVTVRFIAKSARWVIKRWKKPVVETIQNGNCGRDRAQSGPKLPLNPSCSKTLIFFVFVL